MTWSEIQTGQAGEDFFINSNLSLVSSCWLPVTSYSDRRANWGLETGNYVPQCRKRRPMAIGYSLFICSSVEFESPPL